MPYILTPISAYVDHPNSIHYACQFASESNLDLLFYRAANTLASNTNLVLGSTGIGATPAAVFNQHNLIEKLKEQDNALLDNWKKTFSNFPNSQYIIASGTDHDVIKEIVSGEQIDYLMKSSSTEYSWIDKIIPSETSELSNLITCPIISIPPEIEIDKLSTIIYASDLIDEDINGLGKLNQLAQNWNARVYLVHVCTSAQEKNNSKLTLLSHQLTTEKKPIAITLQRDNVTKHLHQLAIKLKANLIVTVKKNKSLVKRLFEPSVSSKLEAFGDIPVMILNPNK